MSADTLATQTQSRKSDGAPTWRNYWATTLQAPNTRLERALPIPPTPSHCRQNKIQIAYFSFWRTTDLVLAYLPDLIHCEVTILDKAPFVPRKSQAHPHLRAFWNGTQPSPAAAFPTCSLPLLIQVSAQTGPSAFVAVPHHPVLIFQITHCNWKWHSLCLCRFLHVSSPGIEGNRCRNGHPVASQGPWRLAQVHSP